MILTSYISHTTRRRSGGQRPRAARRGAPVILLGSLFAALLGPPLGGSGLLGQSAGTVGATAAGLWTRQLDGVKRVLVIGAHPDDEDTALLAALARGLGAEAAYLALSRGEGGQNLIGPELDEGLGVVRTGELLAARRLDGALQYFTRAYDFGYSKSAEETFGHWPRDSLLHDVVWVVRSFRPQVIVSVFSGSDRDGHGQHQAAGLLAREAFDAAGDPERFAAQAARGAHPWTPLKLYRSTWRDPENASLAVPTGTLDPLLGRSHFQLAMASRSQHRSQDFGTAQPAGSRASYLRLLESRVPGPDTSLFAGVDTTLAGLAARVPSRTAAELHEGIARYRDAVAAARRELRSLRPAAAAPALAQAVQELRRLLAALEPASLAGRRGSASAPAGREPHAVEDELRRTLRARLGFAQEALLATAAVQLLPRAEDDLVVPGQALEVEVELWNGGPYAVDAGAPRLATPWEPAGEAPGPESAARLAPGELRAWTLALDLPAAAEPSTPFYLAEPRAGDLYRWPDDPSRWAQPFAPAWLSAHARLTLHIEGRDVPVSVARPVRYRGVDKASGEFWRPVLLIPALAVHLEPGLHVWPAEDRESRPASVTVHNAAPWPLAGRVTLETPRGWQAEPAEQRLSLPAAGTATYTFRVGPEPAAASDAPLLEAARLRAVAVDEAGRTYREGLTLIDYSHIEPTPVLVAAAADLRRFPVATEERRIGYIMGSGDGGPAAIRQLGLEVDVLDPAALGREVFDRYPVLVLGVRAYEVVPELAAANRALLEWVRRGGVAVVQYNKYEFPDGGFAPFPIAFGRPADRVTDETAPVELLEPDSPVLSHPNRIAAADFDGWVQERGLYFPAEWDERYLPLLAMGDPGEPPSRGSLLVASLGEGVYAYTALSLFRQLPAGVPGAYRLLANLLSLEPAAWRAYAERRGMTGG